MSAGRERHRPGAASARFSMPEATPLNASRSDASWSSSQCDLICKPNTMETLDDWVQVAPVVDPEVRAFVYSLVTAVCELVLCN